MTVSDAAGTVVATGALRPGTGLSSGCLFPFTVNDVPTTSDSYSVEVGHRGEVTFGRDDLDLFGAQLSLGG